MSAMAATYREPAQRRVCNVRASSGEAFVERGRSRPVMLTEVPVSERGPILKTYGHISEFDVVAERYPVFRIDPA
jgi:hypothetical protein